MKQLPPKSLPPKSGFLGLNAHKWLPGSPMQLALFLLAWICMHFALRLSLTDVIGVDDVEQQIFAQVLALGYHPKQPPLYTWILHGTETIFGAGLFAAMAVKYGLFAGFLLTYWALTRRLIVSTAHQISCMLSLVMVYQYAWQIHAGFTHSLVLLLTTALTFLQLLRLAEKPTRLQYGLFGLVIGLGILSKYNYVIAALALTLAAMTLADLRQTLFRPAIIISLITAAVVVATPLLWLVQHANMFFGAAPNIAHTNIPPIDPSSPLVDRVKGLQSLITSSIGYVSPLIIVLALSLWRSRKNLAPTRTETHRLTGRFLLAGLGLVALVVLITGADNVKARWLHPLLFIAPLWFMRRIERSQDAWTPGIRNAFAASVLALVVLVPVLRIAEYNVGPPFCKHCRPTWPHTALSQQLWDSLPAPVDIVFAHDDHLAGNLRSRLPDIRVLTPHYSFFTPMDDVVRAKKEGENLQCLAIWDKDKAGPAIPATMVALIETVGIKMPLETHYQDITASNNVLKKDHNWRWLWMPDCL